LANEDYTGGNDVEELRAVLCIWSVLREIITRKISMDEVKNEQKIISV
jgi:hypothetical protein